MTDRLPGIRPRPSLWRMLDATARQTFPVTVTAILLLGLSAPLGLPGQPQLQAAVALAIVLNFYNNHMSVDVDTAEELKG